MRGDQAAHRGLLPDLDFTQKMCGVVYINDGGPKGGGGVCFASVDCSLPTYGNSLLTIYYRTTCSFWQLAQNCYIHHIFSLIANV